MRSAHLTYEEGQRRGRPLLDKYGLQDWRFSIENLRNLECYPPGCLGYCDLEDKVIGIDWRIGRRFRQVMLHEIAHALRGVTGHDAHDEQWYDIASNLGCTFANLVSYFMALPPKGRTI